MAPNFFKPYISIGLHILAWFLLGFTLLFYIPLTWGIAIPSFFWIWQSIVLLFMIIIFYANAKIIVPKTIIKDKISPFLFLSLLIIFAMQLVAYLYSSNTDLHNKMAALLGFKKYGNPYFNNYVFMISLLVLGISTSWAMLHHWQTAAQHKLKLEQDKTMSELAMLKAQINPHFFFNSLNSVYSLTYTNIEDSRCALHTLSRMMRYLLYSTEGERTTLLKEIDFMKDFIALMKLRANSKLTITTDIPEKLNDYPIVPMLLLPLVENAFKHGVNATDKSEIHIALKQKDAIIEFEVENTYFEKTTTAPGGIGLTNTKRRLHLIYPHRHILKSGLNKEGKYNVNLQITLEQ